jgi:hypothetical protein
MLLVRQDWRSGGVTWKANQLKYYVYLRDFVAVIGSIASLVLRSEGPSVVLHRGLPIC